MVKASYCFLNVALHVNVWTENMKQAEGQWSNSGDVETQRGKTQARESLRETRERKKTAPLHKTTAVKNKHSRLI